MTASAAMSAGGPDAGRRWVALGVLVCGAFLTNLDVLIVVVAMPALRHGLGADPGDQQLILAGYQLVYGAGVIAGGRLGDTFGSFRVFGIGMTLFTGASTVCGLAPSAGVLVVARLFQGAGTALMVPQVYRAAQLLFSAERDRRMAFAVIGAAMGVGAVSGQLVGGWVLAADVAGLGWRAVFLVNVPVGAGALALLPWVSGPRRQRLPSAGQPASARSRPDLDLAGTAVAVGTLGLCTVPLVVGRDLGYPLWCRLCLVGALPLAAAFVRHEREVERRGRTPMIPPRLLRSTGFRRGLALLTLINSGVTSFLLVLGLLLQEGLEWGPLATGAGLLPAAGSFALASLLAPGLARLFSDRRLLCLAAAVACAGYAMCAVSAWCGAVPWLMAALGVAGTGMGCFLAPALAMTLRTVAPADSGAASGVIASVQQLGAALGVCVFGAVFFSLTGAGVPWLRAFALTTCAVAPTTVASGVLAALWPVTSRAAPDSSGRTHGRGDTVPADGM
ncbi:MFS transporter [Streptomyces sp. CA-250714]|uniref:MFS transporter n=1 Tax=Streptomyces sp. CA-250714 TaxID=3240060 RepID=UPI003D922847